MPSTQTDELEIIAREIRFRLVEMSHTAKAPHLGSALSCVDILVAAYWGAMDIDPTHPCDPGRDRLVFSKGHAASALYMTLAYRGFFPISDIDQFAQVGCKLSQHPSPDCASGVEAPSGSLGHGLSIGIGMALAGKIMGTKFRVFVVMGDGECNEGSVWEAALFAPAHGLDNVSVIIDYNKWQATGRSNEVMALQPFTSKWEAFGWSAHEIDGHDMNSLAQTFSRIPDGSGKPVAVLAHTVKGKGISFMEDDNNWHYRIPGAEEVRAAKKELMGHEERFCRRDNCPSRPR